MDEMDVKPTWGLAWGLWWRYMLITLGLYAVITLLTIWIMLLAGATVPIPW